MLRPVASHNDSRQIMIIEKKSIFRHLIIVFIISFFPNHSKAATRIVFPADKAIVYQDDLLVIGLADKNTATVDLRLINSQRQEDMKIQVKDSAFSQTIKLAPGLNQIFLSTDTGNTKKIFFSKNNPGKAPEDFRPYYFHSGLKTINTCSQCHPDKRKKRADYTYIDQNFSCLTKTCHQTMGHKKFQHGPLKKKKCFDCHNIHGTFNKDLTTKLRSTLCFSCHADEKDLVTVGKVVHFPVAQGECTPCHDPHESDNGEYYLRESSIIGLCTVCHGDKILRHKYMHEPTAEGGCEACHTPHVSNFKGLLYKKGKDLCITCHEVRKEEFKNKYVHKPVAKDCSLCHDPHGSATKFHLRTKKDKAGHYIKSSQPIKELCLSCHTKLNPDVAAEINSAKVTHKPVKEGKCLICHTPHSTNFPKQLRAPVRELCFSCHKKMAEKIKGRLYKHGPVSKGDCAQCHLVHGSKHKHLLRNNFSTAFRGPFNVKNFKLCLNCHNEKAFTEKESVNTDFRNGTTNLHFLHVNRGKKSFYCSKACHNIHASNQKKDIRSIVRYKRTVKSYIKFTKTATGGGCTVQCHNKPQKYDRRHPVKYKQKN